MNSNTLILIIVFLIIALLSCIWYAFYTSYSNRYKANFQNNNAKNIKFLSVVKPDISLSNFSTECPIVLPNTDDDIAQALKYIKPFSKAGELLENLYGQTRV